MVVGYLRPLSRYSARVVVGVTYVRPSVSRPFCRRRYRPLSRISVPAEVGVTYVRCRAIALLWWLVTYARCRDIALLWWLALHTSVRPSVVCLVVVAVRCRAVALLRWLAQRFFFVAVVRVYSIAHIQSFAPHASYVCTAASVRCVHR